ncbi:unnamed protein product [Fructobacillus tropaeoli]|nr:unnamed protein product [Fructobacillus tropaeoli]
MEWENFAKITQSADWEYLDKCLSSSSGNTFELPYFFENYQHKKAVLDNWGQNHLHKLVAYSRFDDIIRVD